MSLKRLVIDGYGQVELNQVAFRRDGRIEAQCKIAEGIDYVENGMLLSVNKVAGTVSFPTANEGLIALNYSTEHLYDERAQALKDFKVAAGSFLPRLGYLAMGDRFTTNCIAYDTDDFATEEDLATAVAAIATTPLYGQPCSLGAIQITDTLPTGTVALQLVSAPGMPDGQNGFKFVSLK